MRGTLSIDGWSWHKNVNLGSGLISQVYRHARTKWTAQVTYAGPANKFIGLVIRDDKGQHQGLVQSVKELP